MRNTAKMAMRAITLASALMAGVSLAAAQTGMSGMGGMGGMSGMSGMQGMGGMGGMSGMSGMGDRKSVV